MAVINNEAGIYRRWREVRLSEAVDDACVTQAPSPSESWTPAFYDRCRLVGRVASSHWMSRWVQEAAQININYTVGIKILIK